VIGESVSKVIGQLRRIIQVIQACGGH